MYAHIYDATTLQPAATLMMLVDGACSMLHNESGQATLTILADNPEIAPLVTTQGRFDLQKVLLAPTLWMASVRDGNGRQLMQGRIIIQPAAEDRYSITVYDLADEMRLVCLPPQAFFNGLVLDIIPAILAYMPPTSRRSDLAYPVSRIITGERWAVADSVDAINAWTSLDAGRMSVLEAIIAVVEATGNNYALADDGSRLVRIYAEPSGKDQPLANLVKGGFHAREAARHTMTIIGMPAITVENDAVIAGIIPEGGSYQTEDNISKVLRLNGTEYVPPGYRLENLHGYWGVFNESLVGQPVNGSLPLGQIRCEVFGSITPLVNTYESVSAVVSEVRDITIRSAAFAGYPPDHWKDGIASYGGQEAGITTSGGDSITLASVLDVQVNESVDVEVFRPWKNEVITDCRQSLAGAAVAFLESSAKVLVSWQVRVRNSDVMIKLGDYVRLIYSGSVQVVGWHSATTQVLPGVNISDVFVVASMEIVQDETGTEYLDLTLAERLWRFPSGSGLREIMALIQRRMPGVRMGHEGAAYVDPVRPAAVAVRTVESGVPGSILASAMPIIDAADLLSATNVEEALQELASLIGEGVPGGPVAASDVTLVDNGEYFLSSHVEGALQEIGAMIGASTNAGDVVITDSGNYFTGDNVEAALQEIGLTTSTLQAQILTLGLGA